MSPLFYNLTSKIRPPIRNLSKRHRILLTFEVLKNLVLKLQDVLAFVLLFHFEGYVHRKMVVVSLENITCDKKERMLI